MSESERDPENGAPTGGAGEAPERAPGDGGGPGPGGPQRWSGGGDARRRRGRRGRGGAGGGRGPGPGGPFPGPRPAGDDDDSSMQAREVAAWERRQRQPQRGGGWRPPAFGQRPAMPSGRPPFGAPRPFGGQRPGMRPPRGGPRYQEMVRRATAGPRTAAPPEDAGEPISGPHAILEALRAGRILKRIYISSDRTVRTGAVNDLVREAQEKRVQVRFVDALEVQRLSPTVEHQGVVAIAEGRAGVELDELLLHLETRTEPPLVLVIDSLQDPQNFGVLLRSAEGAGVDGVVIPRHRQVGLTPAVARTSAGASEHLLIADVANLRQAIDALKERGIWVVGTDDSGDLEWDAVDYRGATAIVIGGEGEGIRRLVLEGCDQVVRIPMQGKVSSLNAAAAGTIVLFEALRQRMRDAAPPVVERRPPPPKAAAPAEAEDEQDELPEGEDVTDLELEDAGSTDLLRDEDAATGDEIRGDDQDVEGFAESAEAAEGPEEDRVRSEMTPELDTDARDALPPQPEQPKKKAATRKTAVKKTAAKRATRKKTE